MTREEAITTLAKIQKLLAIYPKRKKQRESVNEIDTAIGMAIEALHREEAEEKGYCHRINYIPKPCENANCDCVDVVRCKDCRHRSDGGWCDVYIQPRMETDFCNHGERQET